MKDIKQKILEYANLHGFMHINYSFQSNKDSNLLKNLLDQIDDIIKKYEIILCELFKKKNINYNIRSSYLIQKTIYNSFSDLVKKQKDANYYYCNSIIFLKTIKDIKKHLEFFYSENNEIEIKKYKKSNKNLNEDLLDTSLNYIKSQYHPKNNNIIVKFYCGTFFNLIDDSIILLEEYFYYICNEELKNASKGSYKMTASMFSFLKEILYLKISDNIDISDNSIPLLRVAIENKIRKAFGCYGIIDDKDNFKPLQLSLIFEVIKEILKQNPQSIEFKVSFDDIIRIYNWSNIYMHSGFRTYSWLMYYVANYLSPLFVGTTNKNDYCYNLNGGICIKRNTIQYIWNKLEQKIQEKQKNSTLYGTNNEKELEVLIID